MDYREGKMIEQVLENQAIIDAKLNKLLEIAGYKPEEEESDKDNKN